MNDCYVLEQEDGNFLGLHGPANWDTCIELLKRLAKEKEVTDCNYETGLVSNDQCYEAKIIQATPIEEYHTLDSFLKETLGDDAELFKE